MSVPPVTPGWKVLSIKLMYVAQTLDHTKWMCQVFLSPASEAN